MTFLHNINLNSFNSLHYWSFQLIDPYQLAYHQLIRRLQAIRRTKPLVNSLPYPFITPHDVPSIATTGKPVWIMVLGKGQVTRRIGTQRPEILKAGQFLPHNLTQPSE